MLRRTVALAATILTCSTPAQADPYPPYWQNGAGPAVHFAPVAWPTTWTPYTSQGVPVADRRDADESNGGTSPQGYVNVSSGCTDASSPSIYYAYDSAAQVLFFRWRVQAPPHNFATGPNPGTFASSSPWQSALWTVMIDLNGDGYRDFAVHLNGSSGAPSTAVDHLASIYSRTLTHSLDYLGDPANVALVKHNPTAFVDQATSRILNFRNALAPTPNWPNGSNETSWDYGTTRATLLGTNCGEYFIDYQIPLAMLDATAVGGPAVTPNTPMALLFATSNSLSNPLQKDNVAAGTFVAGAGPLPFGDVFTPSGGTHQQPLVVSAVTIGSCGAATTLSASAMDARTAVSSTVQALDFFRYADVNANGIADDAQSWQLLAAGTPVASGSSTFRATVDFTALPASQYLVGARATDTSTPTNNVTWAFHDSTSLAAAGLTTPPNYTNATPEPGVHTTRFANSCGSIPVTMTAALSPTPAATGATLTMTVTVANGGGSALDVSGITVPLPAGFTYVGNPGGTLGVPGIAPSSGASGTLTLGSFASPTIGSGGSRTLTFQVTASSTPGAYAMQPSGTTTAGAVTGNTVSVEIGAPTLSLGVSTSSPSITPGGAAVNVVATFGNTGTVSATNATMVMTVPAGVTVASTNGGTWAAGPRTITWTLGTLSGLSRSTRTVGVTTASPYTGSSPVAFPVQLAADGPLTASASAGLAVNAPGSALGVDITLSDPNVAGGAAVPLTLQYANASSNSAAGAQLALAIPSGFTFSSASNGGTHSGGTVTWSLGTLAGSASGMVTVTVVASSPWNGLLNPASFVATLSATSAASATDTQLVGVDYASGSTFCSTYYFKRAFFTGSIGSNGYVATTTAPTSGTAETFTMNVTTTEAFAIRFFQDPATPTDVVFNGTLTTHFYISKASGPQLRLQAYVYDYNPANQAKLLLGTQYFQDTGSGTNQLYSFDVPVSGTLAKGHRLLWEVNAYSNNNTTFTFLWDGTGSQSRAAYCVDPPAMPVLDHDVTPLLGAAGTPLTYTTRFGNIGRTNMTMGQLAIAIPDGVSFGSATMNGGAATPTSQVPGDGITTYYFDANSSDQAPGGPIAGGQSGVLVIAADITDPFTGSTGQLQARADLSSTQTSSITDTALTRLLEPTVMTSLTASETLAAPGQTMTYTAVVTNYGAAPANLTLTTTLPVQGYYTYVVNSPTEGGAPVSTESFSSPTLSVPLSPLAAGASATVTWQMQVASSGVPAGTTPLTLHAVVSDGGRVNVTSNNVTINTVAVPGIDVQITSSAPHTPAEAGDVVTVTATITSTGGATATGVRVTGPVFTSGTYVGGSLTLAGTGVLTDVADGDAGSFDGVANAVAVALGDLAPGQVRVISWQVRLDADLPAGSHTITGGGTAVAGNVGSRSDTYEVATTAAVTMTATLSAPASLSMPVGASTGQTSATQVTVSSGTPIVVGQVVSIEGTLATVTGFDGTTVTLDTPVTATAGTAILPTVPYVATCSNQGASTATGVSLVFTLPGGTTLVSATAPNTAAGATVTWAIGTLAPGQTGMREVRVVAAAAADLTGQVVCSSPAGTPVQAQAVTALGGVALTKTTTSLTPVAGAAGLEATYTITARNQRASVATGVTITDSLAPGITYLAPVSVTGATPSGMPASGDRDLLWSGFSVPGSGDVVITFRVALANLSPGIYQNMAAGTSTNLAVLPYDETSSITEDILVSTPIGTTATVQITTSGATATVVLADIDLDTDATTAQTVQVIVTNVNTGEQETITLTETGPSTGVFSGPLPLVSLVGPGPSHDGTMRALPGQTLRVSHPDPLTSTGGPLTVTGSGLLPGDALPPSLTASGGVVTFAQGDGPKVVDAGLVITAGTRVTLTSATISVCTGFIAGQDVLSFTPLHGIDGSFNATSGILSLAGMATVAQWQEVIRTVTYANVAIPVTEGSRSVCVAVSDGTQPSNTVTRTVEVTSATSSHLSYYLTEGAKNAFLRSKVFIANPTGTAANVQVDLYSGLGERHTFTFLLAAISRQVYDLADFSTQITDTAVSTVVTSLDGIPLLVEREVEWGTNGYGATAEQAVAHLSTRLYFAEGAKDPFSPYLVVLNPGSQDAQLTVQFLNADGSAVDSVALVARAGHRETFDLRVIAAEASQAFGMVLDSTQPIAAEHAMYMGDSPTWTIGHSGGATSTPATRWYFSEGTTYLGWDTFLLLANPGTTTATVTVQYHVEHGPTVTRTYPVGAGQRLTVNLREEDPLLASDHFWTEISSDQPIVAERSIYWTTPWTQWTEGHSSPAMAAPRTEWGFAHGREGLSRDAKTYLLFANPNNQPNAVTLRVVTASGERTSTIVIPPHDRVSYHVGLENPLVENMEFWMYLQSSSNLPFLVERSLYWSADGQTWTSGTNVTGIPVVLPH